jgi:hypothetical protein
MRLVVYADVCMPHREAKMPHRVMLIHGTYISRRTDRQTFRNMGGTRGRCAPVPRKGDAARLSPVKGTLRACPPYTIKCTCARVCVWN